MDGPDGGFHQVFHGAFVHAMLMRRRTCSVAGVKSAPTFGRNFGDQGLSGGAAEVASPCCAAVWRARQAGHQQLASTPGTATTGGMETHQQGASSPSAIAQPKLAPQRLQILMRRVLS